MSSCNVLVVDDDPAVLELLTSVLRRDDRHVVGTQDAPTALDEMGRSPFDLVIAGLSNNGDSLDLLRAARRLRPEARVILTAEQADSGRVIESIREQAYSYFHKPLPTGALADMVTQALASPAWQNDIEVVSARQPWIQLRVRCKLDAGDRTVQFLREAYHDIPVHLREDIAAAFRELLMNAIEHGGHSDPEKFVKVSLIRVGRAFVGEVEDPGAGFAMDRIEHAAVNNPEDSPTRHVEIRAEQGQRPGGFGILMTRSLVDELLYNEAGNEVLFVKYLG